MSSNGTSFAFRSLASRESGGESHENLSADAADRYNFDGRSLHFCAEAAIEDASAVDRRNSRDRQGQGPVAGKNICYLPIGHAWRFIEQQACVESCRCFAALHRANEHANGGFSCFAMNGQDREAAEATRQRRQRLSDPIGAPDQGENAAGFQDSPRGVNPVLQHAGLSNVRGLSAFVR